MKNVLWITGTFPPINCGIGRQYKLAKYLPDWNPIILAFDESIFRPQRDEELLKEVEHLEIHRTSSGESKFLQGLVVPGLNKLGLKVGWWKVPDPWIRWKSHAFKEGLRIFHTTPLDAIFSSALPYTCHLVAQELKKETGLPWIADFRDFWSQKDMSYGNASPAEKEMEASVMQEADWITVINQPILDLFREQYPFITGKSSCITHGYDTADYEDLPVKHNSFKDACITYAGTLYGERTKGAISFLKAYKQFLNENKDAPVVVCFIGNCKAITPMVKELKLDDYVTFAPWMEKRESLASLALSSALLFILGDSMVDRYATTGKLLDYLALKKPILGVCPDGVANNMIINSNLGLTAHPDDTEKIVRLLGYFVLAHQQGKLQVQGNSTEQYDVRTKAKEMSGVLNWITTS